MFVQILCFFQVAKFPFEEVPANKQGSKYEPCPSSASSNPVPAGTGSAAALETDIKTGKSHPEY